MTQVTRSEGAQDLKSTELTSQPKVNNVDYPQDAEKVNGRWAMLGFVALIGAYITTGQVIPGIL